MDSDIADFLGGSQEEVVEQISGMLAQQDNTEYIQYISDINEICKTEPGMRFMCGLLMRLGTFDTAWCGNSTIHKRTALKDFGGELLDDIAVCSPAVFTDLQWRMRSMRKLDERLKTKG